MSLRTELEAASQASATILALSTFSSTPSILSTNAFSLFLSTLDIKDWDIATSWELEEVEEEIEEEEEIHAEER